MDGVKLTGLWKNTDKEGKPYLSGTLGGVKVFVFPNKYKTTADGKEPDYNLFFTPNTSKENKSKPENRSFLDTGADL